MVVIWSECRSVLEKVSAVWLVLFPSRAPFMARSYIGLVKAVEHFWFIFLHDKINVCFITIFY